VRKTKLAVSVCFYVQFLSHRACTLCFDRNLQRHRPVSLRQHGSSSLYLLCVFDLCGACRGLYAGRALSDVRCAASGDRTVERRRRMYDLATRWPICFARRRPTIYDRTITDDYGRWYSPADILYCPLFSGRVSHALRPSRNAVSSALYRPGFHAETPEN